MATAADVVTNAGRGHIAGLLSNTVTAPANYFGNVGTGGSTAAVADTTLDTEVATARITATATRVTTTVTNDTAQFVFTFTSASTQTIQNAGVFNASTSGTLVQKSSHASIPLLNTDSIQYTFKLQIV